MLLINGKMAILRKKALVSNCQSHEKSYLSWNKKRYSKDDVILNTYMNFLMENEFNTKFRRIA
jgi:hypothetical protein